LIIKKDKIKIKNLKNFSKNKKKNKKKKIILKLCLIFM
jgi:hypothetical protein